MDFSAEAGLAFTLVETAKKVTVDFEMPATAGLLLWLFPHHRGPVLIEMACMSISL